MEINEALRHVVGIKLRGFNVDYRTLDLFFDDEIVIKIKLEQECGPDYCDVDLSIEVEPFSALSDFDDWGQIQ